MWTPERDARGRNAWLLAIAAMLTPPPSAVGEHFFVRATNSPDGNPFRATEWRDGPETAARSRVSLCAILQSGKFGVPAAIARSLTNHSKKHMLPNVGRAIHLSEPQLNEIGRARHYGDSGGSPTRAAWPRPRRLTPGLPHVGGWSMLRHPAA